MIREEIRCDVCQFLATKLHSLLPVVGGPDWWKWYVVQQLTDAQREMHRNVTAGDLFQLDMAALLRVLYRNWSELAAKGHLPKGKSWVVGKMIDARNRWAHQPAKGADIVELGRDFEAMQQFLVLLDADHQLVDRVRRYKEKIDLKIKSNSSDVQSVSNGQTANASHSVVGIVKGATEATADAINGVSGLLIRKSEFENLGELLKKQSEEYKTLVRSRRLKLTHAARTGKGSLALDTVLVGGETLAAYLNSGTIADEVLNAYELAYPDEAAKMTFAEKIGDLNANQLEGFTSGVKGKLFEIQYANHLNDGNLPDGYQAELAESATNRGWDITINGPDGELADAIQLKATQSASYVKDALERYPEIDVVTTQEVYGQLVMQGLSDNVANSGISSNALDHLIDDAVAGAAPTMDFVPSPISLALIAFSAYSRDDLSEFQKSREFGARVAKSYFAYLAGNTLSVLTQTWWLGLLGGMGSRVMLEKGRQRDTRLAQLENLVESNTRILTRLREPITFRGSA